LAAETEEVRQKAPTIRKRGIMSIVPAHCLPKESELFIFSAPRLKCGVPLPGVTYNSRIETALLPPVDVVGGVKLL
jgi:hypothetical protein